MNIFNENKTLYKKSTIIFPTMISHLKVGYGSYSFLCDERSVIFDFKLGKKLKDIVINRESVYGILDF